MVRFFVESKHDNTTETVFLKTLLNILQISKSEYEFIHVDGKDNLMNTVNKFKENTLSGGRNYIIFDADTKDIGAGYEVTKKRICSTLPEGTVIDGLFLFPNNHDDGTLENLLEHLMQIERHKQFIDCYNDYEHCLGDNYKTPNLKGKLHTYISAQKDLSNSQRNRLGSGQWLFDNPDYWNLDSEYLKPLKDFLNDCFERRDYHL